MSFKEVMIELLSKVDYVHVYLDDILLSKNGTLQDYMHPKRNPSRGRKINKKLSRLIQK
jgi:hypothetical protein